MNRVQRQREYKLVQKQLPIVIDNGSYSCRAGWAGGAEPQVEFRSIVNRPKHRASGEAVNLIGDYDPGVAKHFDFARSSSRSAFDGNVVFQFETMECILDHAFDQLGIQGSKVDHPVLLTECPYNPLYSRGKMAELLFETYDVPSLAFGVDAVFAYHHNQRLGKCDPDGLVLHSGYTTTHAIPMVGGEPVLEACCRTSVGGYHVTDYFKRLLYLQYPYHVNHIVWDKVESLKKQHCYIAENYSDELKLFQNESPEVSEKMRWWQLPWVPPPEKEQPNEEQLAKKAAIREKQGQRLREMAAAKRSTKLADLECEVQTLEQLVEDMDGLDEDQEDQFLEGAGYASRQELVSSLVKATTAYRKAKGEVVEPDKETEEKDADKYPLLEIPDNLLTEEQLKEKKKQKFLKTTAEGRSRAKQKRHEEALQREREQQLEEERRLSNPEKYLEEIKSRHAELSAKLEQRKKQKVSSTNGHAAVSTGRSERLSAMQRERMKLLTKVAFDRGKDEETFGMNDEDWHLYKQMDKDWDDEYEIEEGEAELARLSSRLKQLDPAFLSASSSQGEVTEKVLTEKDYRIGLGVERFRCPEIVFQPSMVGIDQAGAGEMVSISMARLPEELHPRVGNGTVLLSGGNCCFNGFDRRMHAEIRMCRPLGSIIRVVRAGDPCLDAWHGASAYAKSARFPSFCFTKNDYEEKGQDWLRQYKLQYSSS